MHECLDERVINGVYCVVVRAHCINCNQDSILNIPETEWLNWTQADMHIQDAMPSVSADDRELLISGTCGMCFDAMFSDDDYDDYADLRS